MRRMLVLTVAVIATMWGTVGTAHATLPKPPRIYVYGDSLMQEAKAYISMTGLTGGIKADIGRSPCDYLYSLSGYGMGRELPTTKLVVIETAANSSSACMLEPGSTKVHIPIGSPEWEAKYRSDLDGIFAVVQRINPQTRVVLLDPPPMDPSQPASAIRSDLHDTVLPLVAQDIAASYPMASIVGDARDAVGGDTFMQRMPCLPDETATMGCGTDGQITVRAPDGLHFCPTGLGSNRYPCSLPYNPGARRFGNAIEAVVRARV